MTDLQALREKLKDLKRPDKLFTGEIIEAKLDNILILVEVALAEARVDENNSILEVAEHEISLPNHCDLHEKYTSQCNACQKRKWFGITGERLKEIIVERISELQSPQPQQEPKG